MGPLYFCTGYVYGLGAMVSVFLNLKNIEQNVKLSLVFFSHFLSTSLGPKCQRFRITAGHKKPDNRWQVVGDHSRVSDTRSNAHLVPVDDHYPTARERSRMQQKGALSTGRTPAPLHVLILVSHCLPRLSKVCCDVNIYTLVLFMPE